MSAANLGCESGLFVTTDPIQTAKELQTYLAGVPLDNRRDSAVEAFELLGDPRELYGGSHVYVHTFGAFILADGVSSDSTVYHGTYLSDAFLDAHFSRFAYIEHQRMGGICLMLFETKVVASRSNPDFEGESIHSGVFVPVHSVESAFAA